MSRLVTRCCLFLALILPSGPLLAQDADNLPIDQRADDVVAVMQGTMAADDVFDDAFLAQVPAAQFALISQQLTAQFGAVIGVESIERLGPSNARVVLRFERALGTASLNIAVDEPYKVAGLLIQTFDPIDDNLAKIAADLDKLPGTTNILFSPIDPAANPVFARNAETQLAIGSSFKLYLLSALARSVEAGERNWSDIVTINRKSFPSGVMQDWPSGAPVTLHTLAVMMITISDNTATDILFHEVGRKAIERELIASGHASPAKAVPFLSTLELFALKGSPDNAAKYLAADDAGKRRILADFEDDVGGNPSDVTPPRFSAPTLIDSVEWFASARDIQKIMRRIVMLDDPTARDILAISPALSATRTKDWAYVGYKGGSEPGVLNLSWVLQDKAGAWHVLTLGWNNPDAGVSKPTLDLLAQRLIASAP